VGLLGIDKKLVPTRWSITATDDTLGKNLLKNIKEYEEISGYLLFRSSYLSNHFNVLLVPGKWGFEQIEYYSPGCIWVEKNEEPVVMSDHEPFRGRTTYASNVGGAYYACRLAVCEHLEKIKRQATSVIVREIRRGYYVPVGVWQCRENVRHAMASGPENFPSLKEALASLNSGLEGKGMWEKHSELLKTIRSRNVLREFMT
jgi:hypothetical protein